MRCKADVYMESSEDPSQCELEDGHPLPHRIVVAEVHPGEDGVFLWPAPSIPKVFVKALIAPGVHVAQVVNESPGELELWLECADGTRHIRKLVHGQSIYL
jgi:hypothetical protein